jgi:hypothetical protein
MKEYFISNGQDKLGPFTEGQILRALRKGQLNMFNMILDAQKSEWVMLMQHPDFSNLADRPEENQGTIAGAASAAAEGTSVAIGAFIDQALAPVSEPPLHSRRKFPRTACNRNFIYQIGNYIFSALCLDTSEDGMSMLVTDDKYQVKDAVRIKFDDVFEITHFHAKGVIVTKQKVRVSGSSEIHTRYGIRFTHFSSEGKAFVLSQVRKAKAG